MASYGFDSPYGFDIDKLRQQQLFDNYSYSSPYQAVQFQEQPSYDPRDSLDSGLFGMQPSPTAPPSVPTPSSPPVNEVGDPLARTRRLLDSIGQVYTPQTEATDRYNDLLDNTPERNDPSWARRLVAGGMGLKGGLDTMEKVMYAPYLRDMADWSAKTTPFGQAATQENTQNANERQLAGNFLTNITAQDKADLQNQQAIARQEGINTKNANDLKIANDKNGLAYFKIQNPDWKYDFSGPTVIAYNPRNPKETQNTGVATGSISDMEKINLNHTNKMAQIVEEGNQDARVRATVPGGGVPGGGTPGTGVGSTGAGMSPTQQAGAMNLRLGQLYNMDPDGQEFITFDPNDKTYTLNRPQPDIWGNPPPPEVMAKFNRLAGLAYGIQQGAAPPPPGAAVPPPPPQAVPNQARIGAARIGGQGQALPAAGGDSTQQLQPGNVWVQDPSSGAVGQVPIQNVEAFIARESKKGRYFQRID